MDTKLSKLKCCKPFPSSKKCGKDFRSVTESMITKLKSIGCLKQLDTTMRICGRCRMELYHLPSNEPYQHDVEPDGEQPSTSGIQSQPTDIESESIIDIVPSASSLATSTSSESVRKIKLKETIQDFNSGIGAIDVSPIKERHVEKTHYYKRKTKEIMDGLRHNIFHVPEDDDPNTLRTKAKYYDEMMDQLKEKFNDVECTQKEKILVLSVLPMSWTVTKMMEEFDVHRPTATLVRLTFILEKIKFILNIFLYLFLLSQVQSLVAEQGILCSPNPRMGRGLSPEVVQTVVEFYKDDDISRVMPGQRDCVSIVTDGVRQTVQKRLLTMSLNETYKHFMKVHDTVEISFSSFASLRPKYCKLLSKSGFHNVCVCSIHENVDLMLHSLNKLKVSIDQGYFMNQSLCDEQNRTDFCHLRECMNCCDTTFFESNLSEMLEEKDITDVTFEQWVTTDRCNIEQKTLQSDEFASLFVKKVDKLVCHDFIKRKQSQFLKNKKQTLEENEVLIICDFSENFTFVLQDEVQSFHWNNAQCTLHPFVVYFKNNGVLEHISFIIISDILKHDTIAVQLFISKLLEFLQTKISVEKCIFMSDGAASQYKNRKNFSSICGFKEKHNVEIEWHFFATSHGKGPCDAIGGNLKRMAARASLAKQHEHPITNAKQLYDWAIQSKEQMQTKMSFCYVSTEEYEKAVNEYDPIYKKTKCIPGTQKYHSFVPVSSDKIAVKIFSNSIDPPKVFNVFK